MALRHHLQVALVLLGSLLLDAIDDAPGVGGHHRGRRGHVHFGRGLLRFSFSDVYGRRRHLDGGRRRGFHSLDYVGHSGSFCCRHRRRRPRCANALGRDRCRAVHRRVGLAEIRPADQHGVRRGGGVLLRLVVVVEQRDQVQCHAVGGQSRQPTMPTAQPVGSRTVQRDREVGCAVEDLVDKSGQHPTRPHFDEPGDAVARHRFDHLAEPHRLPHLIGELFGHLLAVRLGRRVRVDGEARFRELERLEVLPQGCGARRHHIGMKGRRHR